METNMTYEAICGLEPGERVATLERAGWSRAEATAIVGAEEADELDIEAWRYEDRTPAGEDARRD